MTGETVPMFEPTASDERAGETDTAERCDDPTPRLQLCVDRRIVVGMGSLERFWSKVTIPGDHQCWSWVGRTRHGYGTYSADKTTYRAHRVAYADLVGPIADGNHIHHECRNKACVNPAHLKQMTPLEHAQAHAADRDECTHGHPLSGANLYHEPNGKRRCRACAKARRQVHYWRHRGPNTKPAKAARTHCPDGHPYAGDNLIKRANGHRMCRTCKRAKDREYRARRAS